MRRETENIDQSEARSIPALLPIHGVAQLLVDQVAILKSSEVSCGDFMVVSLLKLKKLDTDIFLTPCRYKM